MTRRLSIERTLTKA